jgi:hypothetical protein
MEHLHTSSSKVQDAVTMNVLETADQLIKIGLKSGAAEPEADFANVNDVSRYVSQADDAIANCSRGARYMTCGAWKPRPGQRRPVLVEAGAGTGKTWLTSQLQFELSALGHINVPLLVPLQQVAVHLQKQGGFNRRRVSWLDRHITLELLLAVASQSWPPEQHDAFHACMLEAFARREVVVILDGIDEASDLAQAVVDFMLKVVVAGGHRLVTTSRPEGLVGVHEGGLDAFLKVQLLPFTAEDQQMVLAQQYPKNPVFFHNLFQFLGQKATMDRLYVESFPARGIEDEPDVNTYEVQRTVHGRPVTTGEELYEVARAAQPVFESLLQGIADELGVSVHRLSSKSADVLPAACVLIAPLKGGGVPNDRVAQKAREYDAGIARGPPKGNKFEKEGSKAGEGMSHVKDINRASILLQDEAQMLAFLGKLKASKRLTLTRLKNLFSPRSLGPTHYRRINCSIGVPVADGVLHLCELQVHQKDIHDHAPDHVVYEYFRELFNEDKLAGFMQKMALLQTIMEVPVLISMLVVAMDTEAGAIFPEVPSTKAGLYQIVLNKQMQRAATAVALPALQRALMWVGAYAHLSKQRLFGKAHVAKALSHDAQCTACWVQLLTDNTDQLPCYKVLDARRAF